MRDLGLDWGLRLSTAVKTTTGGLKAMESPRCPKWVWSAFGEKEFWRGQRTFITFSVTSGSISSHLPDVARQCARDSFLL